jgi:two-component system sensor histidine kinase KdpD
VNDDPSRDLARLRRRYERERRARQDAETIAERATSRLYEADRLKSAFVTNASHELRTPLTAVLGFAETLETRWDEFDEEQRRQFVGLIHTNARTLGELIEHLLDFTRVDRTVELTPQSIDLAEYVTWAVAQVESTVAGHSVVLHADRGSRAHADPVAVHRILVNLLDNAAKYAPGGTTITIRAGVEQGVAVLEVLDEGAPIPAVERERIFERFYRADSETTLRTRGLGIGLAVVRSLAEAMGGSVEVRDGPSGGNRFVVTLPPAPPREETAPS